MAGFKKTEIGLIPEDWEIVNLKELGTLKNGVNFNRNDFGQGYPIINVKNLYSGRYATIDNLNEIKMETISNSKDYELKKGDILFARSSVKASGAGQAAMVNKLPKNKTLFSGFIIRFRNNSKNLNSAFLNYQLRSPIFRNYLTAIATGTTITNLTQSIISNIPIIHPSIHEQTRIADFLSTIDDKIELNNGTNQTLEAISQAIFRHWFINFEFPDKNGHPYKSSGGEMVDSELGIIPSEWKSGELGDILKEKKGKIKKDNEYEVLSAVKTGNLVKSDDYFDKRVYSKDISKYKEVLQYYFAYNPARINIGSIGMLEEDIFGAVSPVYTVIKPMNNFHFFFNMFLKLNSTKTQIMQFCSGTVRQTLDFKGFSKIQIVIPPEKIVLEYNKHYKKLDQVIKHNNKQIETLSQIRDSLLPKLMSGKIRVPMEDTND